jgi:hypothetical protein
MNTKTVSLISGFGLSGTFGAVDFIDVNVERVKDPTVPISDGDLMIRWKLRHRLTFNTTLHSSFEAHSYAKTGVELNTGPIFLANNAMKAPLADKRDEYSDVRNLLQENSRFGDYESDKSSMKMHGFVDFYTEPSNFRNSNKAQEQKVRA